MSDLKRTMLEKADVAKYMQINRRTFLKGALAVGGALALSGCGETETIINTVTVTETKTNTVTETVTNTVTVTESAPSVPATSGEVTNMVTAASAIYPRYERCSGCKICEFECAIYHFGEPRIADSNIKVYCYDILRGTVDIPILCMHCNDTPCMAACPDKVQAISVDEVSGAIIIDNSKCTLCGLCIEACNADRTGCLRIASDESGVVGACDFCGYNPSCVKNCPEDTLDLGVKSGDGKWWAVKAEYIAPKIYNQVFGDYINSLQDYSVLNK